MTASSDPSTLVLHGLRLKGFAEPAAVAEAVAIPEAEAKELLDRLVVEGLSSYRSGRLSGFTLTPRGREVHAQRLSDELDAAGARSAVRDAYRRFLGCNGELLDVCTCWQLRQVEGEPVLNDHSDDAYDAAVVGRLEALHSAAEPICADLASTLDRFGVYGPRLAVALDRVQAGEADWFTKPMIPSYHTVWFELHEDLLATLGLERSSEEPAR